MRGNSLEELFESLELSREATLDQCESPNGPAIELLQKISDCFEITIDDLVDNRIDEEWIKNPTLAPTFQAAAGSRLRTSLAVLRWIENHYGKRPTASLMRSLRIPMKAMSDPDRPVRLRLLGSLLRAERARGLTDSSIFEMGVGAVGIPENAGFLATLARHKSPRQLYEGFFAELIGRFESNYDYKIDRCQSGSIDLRIRPREERISENGFNVVSDRSIAIYRWGVAAGLLKTIGHASAAVTPLHYVGPNSRDEMIRLEWDPSLRAALMFSQHRPLNVPMPKPDPPIA